ncbi:hypothetical protein NSK_002330 [Nannochloropsis salina CCMP1776]|uniref:Methyltransferase FkbM domain-containing protein n=1 Tax=Nannochloropsis salina CCMP1776 TaxID=1027361 RepID=A0A4D9D5M3_9STRA|nr:hypothetical protein NSK_002330 [Nannochloropsis salina CCMP1776]|eukprot:TFJ86676.1 hypothetical protein NSK_002330 [Nannochloropsis salina CCMP1776]
MTHWVAEKDRNVTLFGYAEKDKVSRDIAMHGYWEMENMSVLLLLLERARWQRREWRHPESPSRPPRRDELVMLDVGGNLGAYTLCLATAGFRVLTFEPMRRNIQAIREGICRNSGLKERVILLEKGLAEKEETCTLVVDKENIGDGITRCQGQGVSLGSEEVREDAIQVTTLDRALYCPQSSRDAVPSFYTGRPAGLKMDVEGFEMLVVQGGQGFLNTSDLAVVLHENGHMPFEKRKYLLEYFVDRGYVFLCPEEMYEWVDGRGGKRGRKRKVPKIEAFAEFDERIFDCWDIAWVKKEDVEVEPPRGGRGQRYWLLLD